MAITMEAHYHIKDISWDTACDDNESPADNLPEEVTSLTVELPLGATYWDIVDGIGNALSDEYGYLVSGFSIAVKKF